MSRPTVCVDLDGVLADYSQGFKGIDNIGDPIPGAVDFVQRLAAFAEVVIFTTRCKEYPRPAPLTNHGGDRPPSFDDRPKEELAAVVRAWLDRHGFAYADVYVGQGKPMASAYVDDRAVTCRPQSPFVSQLEDGLEQVWRESLWHVQNLCEAK